MTTKKTTTPKISKKDIPKISKKEYTCTICLSSKLEDQFFVSRSTKLWNISDNRVLFCKDCMDKMFKEWSNIYGSRMALMISCAYLDFPFLNKLYDSSIKQSSVFNIGIYARLLNGIQYKNKTFMTSLTNGELTKSETDIKEERETKWSDKEVISKNRIVSKLRYDPFEEYDEFSRRKMFNLADEYLVAEEATDDTHKVQSVIQIIKAFERMESVDKQLNDELKLGSNNESRVKMLSQITKDSLALINTLAKDNGFAASLNSKGTKGSTSLAYFTKLLDSEKFIEAEVNLFDLRTCESFKQFADISNESIMKQLRLNVDDFGDMFETQKKMILTYQESQDALEEENRKLKLLLQEHNIFFEEYEEEVIFDIDSFDTDTEVEKIDKIDENDLDGDISDL